MQGEPLEPGVPHCPSAQKGRPTKGRSCFPGVRAGRHLTIAPGGQGVACCLLAPGTVHGCGSWWPPTRPEPPTSVPGQELKDLAAQVKDVSVTVGMDSRCHIDLSGIVEEVKVQYDAIAARSLEEAEAYSRSQVRADCAGRRGSQDRRGRASDGCSHLQLVG